jgi:hypothetical protein
MRAPAVAVRGASGELMALTLLVKFLADASQLSAEAGKASGSVKVLGKELDIGVIAKGAAVAGAVGLAASAIIGMTQAAAADRDEQNALATAIEAAGAAHGNWQAILDESIAKGQTLAFTDSEIRASMQDLVTATGDVALANQDLAIAQDIARLSGVDLETASKAVAKAHTGSDGALRKLMPGLAKGATAMDTLAGAQKLAAGSADTYAKSSKGMGEQGSIAFSELTETIGSVFLPILDAIIPALIPILAAFGTLVKSLLPLLVPLVKLLGKALGIVAGILVRVVEVVVKVVSWFGKMARAIGDLLNKIGPLKAIGGFVGNLVGSLNATSGGGGGVSALSATPFATSGQAGWSPVTIHAYGDPQLIESAVVRALRRYDRTNGAAQVLPRWS